VFFILEFLSLIRFDDGNCHLKNSTLENLEEMTKKPSEIVDDVRS
jgi:hypothetical protein